MKEREQPTSVLVVDDSEELREFYSMILRAEGYDVRGAADGEEALRQVARSRPDVMLVDVVMPNMDGFELLTRLRSDFAPPLPPVIVCSGFDVTASEMGRRGATAFLSKPIDPDDLIEAIRSVAEGCVPNAAASARATDRARTRRRRARWRAESSITANALREARVPLVPWFDWMARYFDAQTAAAVIAEKATIQVLAANAGGVVRVGEDVSARLSPCVDVIEAGDILVLSAVREHPSFGPRSGLLGGIGSFVGVPLREGGGAPFGALFLADSAPRRWSTEDVYSLEALGRHGAVAMERVVREGSIESRPAGILARAVFSALLDMEAQTLGRLGGAIEIAVVQLESGASACSVPALKNLHRAAIGVDGDRLLVFKRGRDDESARRAISSILDQVRASTAVRAAVRVAMDGCVGPVHPATLIEIASQLLPEAHMDRIVLRSERAE